MNANEAKAKSNAISHKWPDATRKGWEARKAFAKECGIDVKVFNKGLGPQYERLVAVMRGFKEVDKLAGIDERSVKQLRTEQQKLNQIVTAYMVLTKPNLKPVKHEPEWYAWWNLNDALRGLKNWSEDVMEKAEARLAEHNRKRK